MKEKNKLTWKEVFKNFFLIRTLIPLVLAIFFIAVFGNTSSKGSDLIVGLGVILIIGTILGFLTFLNIVFIKLFKNNKNNENTDI